MANLQCRKWPNIKKTASHTACSALMFIFIRQCTLQNRFLLDLQSGKNVSNTRERREREREREKMCFLCWSLSRRAKPQVQVSPCCLATSVTRLGDFRKFLGDTFCSKSNPNVYWLLRLFWKIWLFVKTAEGIVWATFGKFGILFISPSGHTVIAMYLKVKCRG